jgi:hypothetical protein
VRTGLVTPGSVAAATSKSINVKTGDSVKGWFLTKCSPQDIVDRPVETGEKSVGQAFQWLAAESERGMPKRDKNTGFGRFRGGISGPNELCDSLSRIRPRAHRWRW